MDDVLAREKALNETLRQGRLLEAYTTFYRDGDRADPAQPDADASAVALRFFEWADTFVGAVPVRTMAGNDVSCSEWRGAWSAHRDAAGDGCRIVARHWQDGKVIRERVTLRRSSALTRPARALKGHRIPPVPAHG
jgi:hypothetical protein